ncbi:MAG: putative hemolysin [Paraglaciecola sp.]|jgi:putative hemolysin
MSTHVSLVNIVPKSKRNSIFDLLLKLLDKMLGITKLDQLYKLHGLAGLGKDDFAEKLINGLNITLEGVEELRAKIPKNGPVVIASNHPFGGIEGVILSWVLGQVRPDLKVLANKGLKIFPELEDYFIFTNPLSENDPKNGPSLRTSLRHVKQGGALLIFPAGRVSYYHKDKKRITDHNWNRLVANLVTRGKADYLPVFVSGQNSPLFYRLGRVYYRFRMLMLPRELVNKQNACIQLSAGNPVAAKTYANGIDLNTQTALCRAQSYAQDPNWRMPWPQDSDTSLLPLAAEISGPQILAEIEKLPLQQHLLEYKDFAVYYGYQQQLPKIVNEIARLRELTFREHNEGSGAPLDTDHFDATYTHLFVTKRSSGQIIGAYRMGQTDKLLADGNINNLYLSRMFDFKPDFVNQQQPCLEMGRSFLIPEYQRSYLGLYLLWRGIGAFVCKFPRYRTLYGTVSLSKLYDTRSVALIETAMVTPTKNVKPRSAFHFPLHPELQEFASSFDMEQHLTTLLRSIESDGKDIPILLKHYQKLGARFHCLGIDNNFNDTPGLLLSVDLPAAPEKSLKLYLAESFEDYKNYTK